MLRTVTDRRCIEARRIGSPGWCGEYERLERPAGAVALLPSPPCGAAACRSMCSVLHDHGFSTLCIEPGRAAGLDELTPRLVEALEWLRVSGPGAPLGVFGGGIGACAALRAAALRPDLVEALVAQGACPEPVLAEFPRVRAATLLVIGDGDEVLLRSHRRALPRLAGARRLEVVPGADAGCGDEAAAQAVAHLAAHWFALRLPQRPLH
jgi:pimeloyl-ACP methyl ester carboxylesterase